MWPTACPTCGRAAIGRAFPTTTAYVRDSAGHVFPTEPEAGE